MGAKDSMWASRIYELGDEIGSFDKYYGVKTITRTKDKKELYFVGFGATRKSDSDIENGDIYFDDLLLDTAKEKAGTRLWHHANFTEREDNKYVTLDESLASSLDGYESTTKYYTYKFKDKETGMTIGDLKKLDSKFAEMLENLKEQAKAEEKVLKYTKNGEEEKDVEDSTLIDGTITIKFGNPTFEVLP